MIGLKEVTKSYHLVGQEIPVLKGVNLSIKDGELVALMGPSGSGKSTTMNIIGLLDRPTSGQYFLNGKDVSQLTSDEQATVRNQSIGFIFQQFFLLPRLSALQNVILPMTYRKYKQDADLKKLALSIMERVGVAQLAAHKPIEMSGGQQQRVAIARALIGSPHLILADEPTGSLDSKTGQEVMNLLIELNHKVKATILVVTHDEKVAAQCHRIIRVQDGKII